MKTLFLIAAILLSGIVAKAQEVFFPTKEGTVLEYKSYDKRDRETGMLRYTVTHIVSSGDNMDITYLIETMDKKGKTLFKEEITINKKGDKLYVDMSKFIDKAALEQAGEMPAEIKVSGNDMEIPSNLKEGDKLPDSKIEMSLNMGFINIKMEAQVTDRKVESFGNISVKAGNYDAYKITSNVSANAMGIKTSTKTAEWLVKGIGIVRSEEYDENGNINSYSELVSIKNN